MRDLEVILPVSAKGKYEQRLQDFQKYGLVNTSAKNTLVTLLVGPEKFPNNWLAGWPDGVEARIHPGPYHHPSSKIYEYVPNLSDARWYLKIDDDSFTDIGGLLELLDLDYPSGRHYISCGTSYTLHDPEISVLRKMGFGRWTHHPHSFAHEQEASLVSKEAMEAILTNKIAMEFMEHRAKIEKGYTDISLAAAAKMCGVHATDAWFMTNQPNLKNFSLFGGHLQHIHWISRDKHPYLLELITNKIEGRTLDSPLAGCQYTFSKNGIKCDCFLRPDGCIDSGHEETVWRHDDKGLHFFQRHGHLSITMTPQGKDFTAAKGKATLRRIDKMLHI